MAVTSEMQGEVLETAKEQDIQMFPALQSKNLDEIDFVELEYGTLTSTFNNIRACKANIETKKL